jgi:hypothetical protein
MGFVRYWKMDSYPWTDCWWRQIRHLCILTLVLPSYQCTSRRLWLRGMWFIYYISQCQFVCTPSCLCAGFKVNCFQMFVIFCCFKVFNVPTAILYLPAQWAMFTTCHCRNDCSIYEEACWRGGACNSLQCAQNFWSFSVTWSSTRSWYYIGSPLICSSGVASVEIVIQGVCWSYLVIVLPSSRM